LPAIHERGKAGILRDALTRTKASVEANLARLNATLARLDATLADFDAIPPRWPRRAPAAAPAPYWNAWRRLDELEAFIQDERIETMEKLAELQAAVARLIDLNRQLVAGLAAARAHNSDLANQVAAQPDPASVQGLIDQANAAANDAAAAIGG
jgi:hypothetical protein